MASPIAVLPIPGATHAKGPSWDETAGHDQARPAVDWDESMRKHGRRVLVYLVARGVAAERAKELAQDAWLRVMQAYQQGRLTELRLPGVVIAQAGFLALDERRQHQRRSQHGEAPSVAQPDAWADGDAQTFERQLVARESLRKIQKVVARSHPNAQKVFDLMYGGQAHTPTEVAKLLGLSVQRVRQITCELRKRIRAEIGGHQHGR